MIWLSCFKLKTTYSSKNHPRFPQLNHSMASLLSTQGTSLFVWIPGGWHHAIGTTSLGIQGKKGRKMAMKLKHDSWFRVFFVFFCLGGKEKFLRLNCRNFQGHFPNVWEIPLLLGMFLVFQIIQPLGFWMLMWSTNLLSYLSARTKDCQGQKSQSDEGHKSWRNHNLLEDGVMSRG